MFTSPTAVMLYVDDVPAERAFWEAVGARIVTEEEVMGSLTFTFTPDEGGTHFTVYDKDFIRQVSPEVVGNVPSVLFTSSDLPALHARITEQTETVGEIVDVPFENFNFASPSGIYFAVRSA